MNSTLSVAVLSGKGGVGKTNLSLNLACALYQAGFKNLLMDCDMGLANLDVLLGITPEGNLQDALLGDARLSDVLYPLEPKGFDVLPAASGSFLSIRTWPSSTGSRCRKWRQAPFSFSKAPWASLGDSA